MTATGPTSTALLHPKIPGSPINTTSSLQPIPIPFLRQALPIAQMLTNLLALFTFLFTLLSSVRAEDFVDATIAAGHGNAWKYGTGGGLIGLIVFVLDVMVFSMSLPLCFPLLPFLEGFDGMYANEMTIVEVVKSTRPTSHKLLWIAVVFFFPVLGLILYALFSNREGHRSSGADYETLP
ncbi:hypothetical protein G7K_5061-t2 [Saitoella complicata NRRL Y-17804]|uniref:Cardiolipin synthase N-terminal domain-containing protein n=1 Tax=Saitoella complicata (strain BCRC 22490 / CBS 7301 / JCM 7358 / NBRC 10748 / NRRL Y-17804) TaxID=698492 RepID=A0A0E9NMC7_SAICN|nr:hypothetical protein G7K_5061-t2 [Saitoella complicata NRRL Y-17804]